MNKVKKFLDDKTRQTMDQIKVAQCRKVMTISGLSPTFGIWRHTSSEHRDSTIQFVSPLFKAAYKNIGSLANNDASRSKLDTFMIKWLVNILNIRKCFYASSPKCGFSLSVNNIICCPMRELHQGRDQILHSWQSNQNIPISKFTSEK